MVKSRTVLHKYVQSAINCEADQTACIIALQAGLHLFTGNFLYELSVIKNVCSFTFRFVPYVGIVTILMNDYPKFKVSLVINLNVIEIGALLVLACRPFYGT